MNIQWRLAEYWIIVFYNNKAITWIMYVYVCIRKIEF